MVGGDTGRGLNPAPIGSASSSALARLPAPVATDEIGGTLDPEVEQRGRRQTGVVALIAEEDHLLTRSQIESSRIARGSEPPFEDQSLDDHGTRHLAILLAIDLGSEIDEEGPALDGNIEIGRFHALDTGPSRFEVLVDRGHRPRWYPG